MSDRILVVDSQPDSWDVTVAALENNGFRVTMAPDGLVGLNAAEKMVPCVVVLEIDLSRLHGIELCRRLKANVATGNVPVIFASWNNNESVIVEAFAAGASDYVVKPIRPREFVARLRAQQRLANTFNTMRALPSLHSPPDPAAPAMATTPSATGPDETFNLEQVEAMLIQRALEKTKGNVARAARLLGINRSRIYRKFSNRIHPS